jgi:hypothetical protein
VPKHLSIADLERDNGIFGLFASTAADAEVAISRSELASANSTDFGVGDLVDVESDFNVAFNGSEFRNIE